jgi:hypothetical protein
MNIPDETAPNDPPVDDATAEAKDGLEHVSDLLIELWKDYKNSHLPNLIYSVAFVGGVLTLGNTSELFKRVSEDGRVLVTLAVFLCISAAGMAMMHRFSSQLFMEIETLPADRAMRYYFRVRNSTHKKITYSYGYGPSFIELFKFLHTVTKYLTSLFLYFAWVMFGLALVLAFLRPADCKNGMRPVADEKIEVCTWSKSNYANFVDWLVSWISRDFWLGETMIALVVITVAVTCLSLRQPNAYRPKNDPFGPMAWPVLIGSVSLFLVHVFCYFHSIELFGVEFYRLQNLAKIFGITLLLAITLSIWRLKERARRFNPEFGDYSLSSHLIKSEQKK